MTLDTRSYFRFAVSLRRRSRAMQRGQHDNDHALAMRLASVHIALLAKQLALSHRQAEIAVGLLQAHRSGVLPALASTSGQADLLEAQP